MARFGVNDADHYGGQGGAGFFSIAQDKEVKTVRFLYNTIDDVTGYSVHEVDVATNGGTKKRYVNCLRDYNEPIDKCPFCRDKKFVKAKYFIPVYNLDEEQVQIWDRGKNFGSKLSSLCARYASKDGDTLVSHIFEIERNGKPHDTSTTYEVYEQDQDDTTLEEFEVPDIVGGLVLDKTAEDMEYYLEAGEFPPTEDDEEQQPVRRNSESRSSSRGAERRTPGSRRRGERI